MGETLFRFLTLARLLSLWKRTQFAAESEQWASADAQELREFLDGRAGMKLGRMLRNLILRESLQAIRADGTAITRQCGRAVGLQDAVTMLDDFAQWDSTFAGSPQDDRPSDNLSWLHRQAQP